MSRYPLRIDIGDAAFRPGEMVTATITLSNATDRAITVVPPQALQAKADSNLNLYLLVPDSERLLRRTPIIFPKNPPETPEEIQPGESLTRRLAFTNLTEQRGVFQFQAHYEMSLTEEGRKPSREMLISEPVAITVDGTRAFRRDRDGLILREDAVLVAQEKHGGAIKSTYAFLHQNEAGLLDWWITLEKMPYDVGSGESRLEAFYVSPYGGFVIENRQAIPYVPKPGETPETAHANE